MMAKTLISLLLALILLLLAFGVAQVHQRSAQNQQSSDELWVAASKGDKTALQQLRTRAEQGRPDAQTNLGLMYANGEGVPKDRAQAVEWIRKGAEQGFAEAENNFGLMYQEGDGVPKELVFAYLWFDLAAAQGHEEAKRNREIIEKQMTPDQIALSLAVVKAKQSVAQTQQRSHELWVAASKGDKTAFEQLRMSAEQGDVGAQTNLGLMYANGEGVPKDLVTAYMWITLAAAESDDIAKTNRNIIEKQMTPDQIAEAQRLSREWKPK